MSAPGSDADAHFFLGRERELDDLTAALAEARSGRGRLYLVRGEDGIGKTSLVEELSSRARAADFGVYWGRCWDDESAPPYWPWVQLLRACARDGCAALLKAPPAISADLARLLPELSTGARIDTAADSEQERFRLFGSLTQALRRAAAARPTVLVLDDLHAADSRSLLLLRFLARELRSAAILVVGTYREGDARRSEGVRELLADIGREGRTMSLVGLGAGEVRRFARQRTGLALDENLLAELQRITEGNPFFLLEVLQLLADERRAAARWPTARSRERARRHSSPPGRSPGIDLRDPGRRCRSRPRVRRGGAREGCGSSTGASADLLAPAVEAGLLRPAGASRHAFARPLVREALYEDLPFPQRTELHRRAGLALLESNPEENIDELAHHFLRAAACGGVETAVTWATRAGDRAMEHVAYEAAAGPFSRALAAIREAPSLPGSLDAWQRRRIELLTRLGAANLRSGDVAAADEAYVDAFSRARTIGNGPLMARAALGLGHVRLERGRSDATLLQWLEETLAFLGPDESALRARVMARLTESSYFTRLEPWRLELSRQAVEAARQSGDRGALADALNARHHELWQPDSMRERLALADEITRLADEAGEQTRALSGLGWRIHSLLELGEMAAADQTIAEYQRRAESLRLARYQWFANVFRTGRALLRGAFDEAERLLREGIRIRETTDTSPSQFHAGQMFALRREQGRVAEAGSALRAVLQLYPSATSWICILTLFQVEAGETAEARAAFARFAAEGFESINVDATWLTSMTMLAEVCAALRDTAAASTLYSLLLPYSMHNVVTVGGVICGGAVPYFLGLLAATQERWEVAATHLEEACARHEKMGAWPLFAHAQHARAAALVHCGRKDEAASLRTAALATARELGLVRLLRQADPTPAGTAPPTAPATALSFRHDRDHWAVVFGGEVIRLRSSRGCEYLAYLLARPGERVAAVDLLASRPGGPPASGEEQARIAVRKAIQVVLRALGAEHPALHAHLSGSLRTGRWCVYEPDPPLAAPWEVVF